jgi:hypothetical protein
MGKNGSDVGPGLFVPLPGPGKDAHGYVRVSSSFQRRYDSPRRENDRHLPHPADLAARWPFFISKTDPRAMFQGL